MTARQTIDAPVGEQTGTWVSTVCYMCQNTCGIRVQVVNGVVVSVEGDSNNPHNSGKMCAKGNSAILGMYHPRRVLTPLKRTSSEKGLGVDPKWEPISWEEALGVVTEKLKKIREDDPRKLALVSFDAQGMYGIGAAFFSAFGTPNITTGSSGYFCGNSFHPITYSVHGAFFAEPDLDYANYCIFFGSQNGFVANTNPMALAAKMADARMRGMKLVVVDPICCNAGAKADEWIPIYPGTDAALALGLANVLVNELGIYDRDFLRTYTNAPYLLDGSGHYVREEGTGKPLMWDLADQVGKPFDGSFGEAALEGQYTVMDKTCRPAFQVLREHLKKYPPERASEITTVPAATISRLAKEFGMAARIGSTIIIDGKELPFRPAHVNWNRGIIAHKYSMHNGWAIQLLNTLVGAIDVPGGHIGVNAVGPDWTVGQGLEGMLVPSKKMLLYGGPYPARKIRQPETAELAELFAVTFHAGTMVPSALLEPEKYRLPYHVEGIIHVQTNTVMTSASPKVMAEALAKVPFMVSFATLLEETVELADIVLPNAHWLERMDMFPNLLIEWMLAGKSEWYWMLRQPVVKPMGQARHWMEVLWELGDRLGMREEHNRVANAILELKEPFALGPDEVVSYEEVCDRWAKSKLGVEHGLEWLKGHGVMRLGEKTVEEAYPRAFLKPRIPLYQEHYIDAAIDVEKTAAKLGISPWDVSGYQPLPEWKQCPAQQKGGTEYDLLLVNSKLPFHSHAYTAENPWLSELTDAHPYGRDVLINTETARKKGIKDDDEVCVESVYGEKAKGRAKLSECVHPAVAGTMGIFGHWARDSLVAKGKGFHFNSMLPYDVEERIDTVSAAFDMCVKVKVYRA